MQQLRQMFSWLLFVSCFFESGLCRLAWLQIRNSASACQTLGLQAPDHLILKLSLCLSPVLSPSLGSQPTAMLGSWAGTSRLHTRPAC